MMPFDPYQNWLGIPPHEQPANLYRLLGIALFESNPEVIAQAADRQVFHVGTFQAGQHAETCQQVLYELAVARGCLLDPQQKAQYDLQLQGMLASRTERAVASPPPPAGTQIQGGPAGPPPTGAEGFPAPMNNNAGVAGGYGTGAGGFAGANEGFRPVAGTFSPTERRESPMPAFNLPPGGSPMVGPNPVPMAPMPMAGPAPAGMPMPATFGQAAPSPFPQAAPTPFPQAAPSQFPQAAPMQFPQAASMPAAAMMPVAAAMPMAATPMRAQPLPAPAPAMPPPAAPPTEAESLADIARPTSVRRRIVRQKKTVPTEWIVGGVVLAVAGILVLVWLVVNGVDPNAKRGFEGLTPDKPSVTAKPTTAVVDKDKKAGGKAKHDDNGKRTAKAKRADSKFPDTVRPSPYAPSRAPTPASDTDADIIAPLDFGSAPRGGNATPQPGRPQREDDSDDGRIDRAIGGKAQEAK